MATGTPRPPVATPWNFSPVYTESPSTARDSSPHKVSSSSQPCTRWPCCRSGTVLEFHGPPRERAGAQGRNAAPSGGGEGEPRRSLTTTMGRVRRPHDATPSRRSRGGTPGPEVATLVQGRFKRDGSAAAEPEPRGGPTAAPPPSTPRTRAGSSPATTATVARPGAVRPAKGDGGPRPTCARKPARARRPRFANSSAQLAHQHPPRLAARTPRGRGDLAGRAAHQRQPGRHPAARQHAAADRDDQAGDRARRRAPGGARPVGRPAGQRRDGQRLQSSRAHATRPTGPGNFIEATDDIDTASNERHARRRPRQRWSISPAS